MYTYILPNISDRRSLTHGYTIWIIQAYGYTWAFDTFIRILRVNRNTFYTKRCDIRTLKGLGVVIMAGSHTTFK